MIHASYDDGGWAERTRQRMRSIPDALTEVAEDQASRLSDEIKAGLSGGVLQDSQGTLAQSLSVAIEPNSAGVTAILTCDAPYAAFQNYGFSGTEQVAAHLRSISVVYGRPLANPVEAMVGPSVRRVDYAGTGFISQPFADSEETIAAAFAEGVAGEFGS